eukprot:750938-Hanusia_phi.AAC.1
MTFPSAQVQLYLVLCFILGQYARKCTAASSDNNGTLFALAPFQSNQAWYDELVAATQSRWPSSYYQGQQPPSYSSASALALPAQNYQEAIKSLLSDPRGGRLAEASRVWRWNSPATGSACLTWRDDATDVLATAGGVVLTIFGIGFGYDPSPCSEADLSASPCKPSVSPPCMYVDALLGETKGQNVTWISDSSLTLISSPGLSYDLTVNVTAGQCKE